MLAIRLLSLIWANFAAFGTGYRLSRGSARASLQCLFPPMASSITLPIRVHLWNNVMVQRRKLIEVSIPLEAINAEAQRRKQKAPKGYPTSIHKYWAQRPVAACRAVLFAQL